MNAPTTYTTFMTESRRLALLGGLRASHQWRANDALLQRWCEQMGHAVSTDRVVADLAWLAEQDLVSTQAVDGLTVATLTQRGLDVANGLAQVPGVQRPQPGHAGG
jgi:hypothetical protein